MMYGKYVADGTVNFDRTVKEIGLDDVQPFLPVEAGATLRQLLMARSGIYLDANNHNLSDLNPKRGSQQPGTYFQYQNWDFNAAGTAFEKLTGKNLYDALEADLAKPLGFQDWNRERQKKASSMPESVHPEYPMYLSTRDMARLGLLMLQDGMWNGKRLMPAGWAKQITTLVTRPEEIHPMGAGGSGTASRAGRWGYGTLWWVWDAPLWPNVITGPYQGAYTAMGANGQYITVFPLYDIVVVHKVDIDRDETSEVTPEEYTAVLDMLVASVCPGQCQ
jgi:CubicO group peptidase (beta-lactamase class C family)